MEITNPIFPGQFDDSIQTVDYFRGQIDNHHNNLLQGLRNQCGFQRVHTSFSPLQISSFKSPLRYTIQTPLFILRFYLFIHFQKR